MNSSLLLAACLLFATVCAQTNVEQHHNKNNKAARYPTGAYYHSGATSVNNVANASAQVYPWGSGGGTLHYGIIVTNLADVLRWSFYLTGYLTSTFYPSDSFVGEIYETDGTTVSTLVWSGNYTLGNVAGSSVNSVNYNSRTFNKVSATLPAPLALNPSKSYYFGFFVTQSANQYYYLESSSGGGLLYYMNSGDFPTLNRWVDGLAITFEIERGRVWMVDVTSATPVPTSGGVTTIRGTFGNNVFVTISGQPCPVIYSDSTTIQCQAPAGVRENNPLTVYSNSQNVTRNIFSYYDVNECSMANTCAAGFTCVNTYGSFLCVDSNSGLFCNCPVTPTSGPTFAPTPAPTFAPTQPPTPAPTQPPTPAPTQPPTTPPTPTPSSYFQITDGNGLAIGLGNGGIRGYLKIFTSNPSDWTQQWFLVAGPDVGLGPGNFVVSRAYPNLNFDVSGAFRVGVRVQAYERKATQAQTGGQRFNVDLTRGLFSPAGNPAFKIGIVGNNVQFVDSTDMNYMLQVVAAS